MSLNAQDGNRGADLQQQRDRARRSLLRANTAVAVVLLVVLALATAAMWLSWRATRLRDEAQGNQYRAEQAEAKARADLWRAYVSEAKATRLGTALERRGAALDSIRRAAAIHASAELRNEAVATLALPGFELESFTALDPAINRFATDPELRRWAIGYTNGDVVIRTLADGAELKRFTREAGGIPREQSRPGGVQFSPDGKRLSVRYNGGAFAVWDIESSRRLLVHNIDKQRNLAAEPQFTTDGRYIMAPVFAPKNGMAVFDLETGREVAFFSEFNSFRHASPHPTARMFASNNGTNVVALNWETGERIEFDFSAGVRRTAWSPDGRELVIAGNALDVHVWNVAERRRRVLSGHKGDVFEAVFDPDGSRLATSSEDGTSRIWDLRNDRFLGATADSYISGWAASNRVGCVRMGKSLEVRRLIPSVVYETLPGGVPDGDPRTLDVSFSGVWAASMVEERGLLVWNLHTSDVAQWIPVPAVRSICFHPSEPRLFLTKSSGAESVPFTVITNHGRAAFQLGEATKLAAVPRKNLDRMTISATGKTMAWVELGGGNVWVEQLDKPGKPVRMHGTLHSSVAYQSSSPRGGGTITLSPDGRWLVCGYGWPGTDVCDTGTGERVRQIHNRHGNVQFSPDGQYLVLGARDQCRVYRVSDWSVIWDVACAPSVTSVAAAAFSPDSTLVAIAKTARSAALFDVATGRELAEMEAPAPAPIASARWTPDGKRIVFSTRENHLDIWQPAALQRELSALGLNWGTAGPMVAAIAPGPASRGGGWPAAVIAAGALATVALVAIVASLSLRRHRRLIEDFSRTEALAAQRERELEGAREVNRLKSSFVSMVSHEFRTPLGIIQSSAQILDRYLDRLPPERRREQLDSIAKNVRRMAGLIDEVLLLGKVEAGRMIFSPAPIDLESFCRRLVDEMTSATHRRCPIRLEFATIEFPPAQADETLLRHILGNLISNASKYSEPGSEVEVSVTRQNSNAVFTVRDRGVGIPAGDRGKLFVAFQRGSNVSRIHGTGLGLTIVKRCAELHGGQVSFASEEGEGTAFTVIIPMFEKEKDL